MKDASYLIQTISDLIKIVGPILLAVMASHLNSKKSDRDYIEETNDRLNKENKELREENKKLRKELNDDD